MHDPLTYEKDTPSKATGFDSHLKDDQGTKHRMDIRWVDLTLFKLPWWVMGMALRVNGTSGLLLEVALSSALDHIPFVST